MLSSHDLPGTLKDYGGNLQPGHLLADGSAVSRTLYADLFAFIGTTWGVGDGSTTFNIPDSRGRGTLGSGTGPSLTARTLGQLVGEESHVLTDAELAPHSHSAATGVDSPDHVHGPFAGRQLIAAQPGAGGIFSSTLPAGSDADAVNSPGAGTGGASTRHTHTITSDGGGLGHNNIQPSLVVTKMVRY